MNLKLKNHISPRLEFIPLHIVYIVYIYTLKEERYLVFENQLPLLQLPSHHRLLLLFHTKLQRERERKELKRSYVYIARNP